MVFDLGTVRLQAPEGWIRLESRGKRIVLRDPGCPTPIFVEQLYRIERVDRWIAALATGGKRITGFQQTPDFSGRRFVLEASGGQSPLQRAYRIHRVHSGDRSSWVAASIDLDGDRQRNRILGALFSRTAETSVYEAVHLFQYLEDDQRETNGRVGPGLTLALPRSHEIHDVDGNRYLIHDGRALIGWMTVDTRSQVAIEFASEQGADRGEELPRAVRAGLRIWDTEFQGHWRPPVHVEWRDAKLPAAPAAFRPTPAPPPATPRPPAASPAPSAPPGQQLQAEWDARLKGAYLGYEGTGSSGYDPRFSFGAYRKEFIVLSADHDVSWDEVVHTSSSYAGIYVGGPTRTQRSGIWRVELENGVPRLVLYCGREGGVHHFDLGAVSASYVTCNGRRYTLVK